MLTNPTKLVLSSSTGDAHAVHSPFGLETWRQRIVPRQGMTRSCMTLGAIPLGNDSEPIPLGARVRHGAILASKPGPGARRRAGAISLTLNSLDPKVRNVPDYSPHWPRLRPQRSRPAGPASAVHRKEATHETIRARVQA
jgi:hypothetical protein